MSKQPTAVERQAEESERLLQEEIERRKKEQSEPVATVETAPTPEEPAEAIPTPEPEEPTPTPELDYDRLKAEHETLNASYQTLQGKYTAEVPRLSAQIRELKATLAELSEKLSTQSPKKPGYQRYLKLDEAEKYEAEALDLQGRLARGEAEDVVEQKTKELAAKIAQLEERLQSAPPPVAVPAQQPTADPKWQRVNSLEENAAQINASDPKWFQFLNTVDPASGVLRREIGQAAYQAGDIKRLADLVKEFKVETNYDENLERQRNSQVKPRKLSAEPPAPKDRPVIKESTIKAFYTDVAKGKYKNRPDEATKLEAEYDQAMVDGRILIGR